MKMRRLLSRIKRKILYITTGVFSIFSGDKSIRKLEKSLMMYKMLERKYGRFLEGLPKYSGSKEYSNIVWWCWLQGEENAPDLCKVCLRSLRENLKDREIIVVTNENYLDYVDFPKYILEKYKNGFISNTHFSDLLRLQLLVKYGGTWIDSSVFCTGYDEELFDRDLFVFSNYLTNDSTSVLSNWFITAEKNNPILETTRDLLFEYWRRNNVAIDYFIFHKFFTMACKRYSRLWKRVPTFSNVPPHILQFELQEKYSKERMEQIKSFATVHKLSQHLDQLKFGPETNYGRILNGEWGTE